ncbi:MAG TPA: hypothetical protein VFN95_01530 [Flavitalea sp.]|nr:hypothetical protein [Flavitalea sp.]
MTVFFHHSRFSWPITNDYLTIRTVNSYFTVPHLPHVLENLFQIRPARSNKMKGAPMNSTANSEEKIAWQKVVALYARPDLPRSIWQTINTLVPYFLLFYLSMRSLEISFWLTLPLTLLTAGFLVRTFIIFHDCDHGSFFKSQRANDLLGMFTGNPGLHPLLRLEA